jgi:hypothetical protein
MDKIAKNLEENKGFVSIKSPLDGLYYKVVDTGSSEEKIEVAKNLSMVRRDLNKLLIYLCKNPQLWINQPIAFGIIHTLNIHIPCLYDIFDTVISNKNTSEIINLINKDPNLFLIQEMTPNEYGIIGLNKPRKLKKIKLPDGSGDYEISAERSIHMTIRNKGKINDYLKILDLALHEITHTTCNDIYWDNEDNHKYPYPVFHSKMRNWAKDCGIK